MDVDTKEGNALIGKTSVYKSTDILLILEEVGRVLYEKKIKVEVK